VKLLFENWRRYLKEAEGTSPVTGKPYPKGLPEKDKEKHDAWAAGKFSPDDIGTGKKQASTAATGRKDLKTQLQLVKMETVGDLKKAIKLANRAKTKQQLKGLVSDELLNAIPWAHFSKAKSAFGLVASMFKKADDKETNTALDALDIDPEISAIVDNGVEANFLAWLKGSIKGVSDDTPLQKLDMNQLLQKFLKQRYKQRTVSIPKGAK